MPVRSEASADYGTGGCGFADTASDSVRETRKWRSAWAPVTERICDREGDIWELFCLAEELDTHFLIRRCSDRFAGDGSLTVESIMAEEKVRGLHSVAVRDDKGKLGSTQVELSYRRMILLPPIAKRKRYPALTLTVLHAREPEEPVGRPRVDWKLITDLRSPSSAAPP